jgi:hypothetical protein
MHRQKTVEPDRLAGSAQSVQDVPRRGPRLPRGAKEKEQELSVG